MTETTTIPSRIAALADNSQLVHGIAISAGEVTRGLNGRKKWPADALRAAASSLEGTPVNPLHSESEVGRVRRATYDETRDAIVYELELTDAKLADQVRSGGLEVSIEAKHGISGTTADGAMLVDSITFSGIALVQHGASATASAEHGPAPEQAFAAALSAGQIQSALAEGDVDQEAIADEFESVIGPEHIFPNPNLAVAWADDNGLDGEIHETDVDGTTIYMPGATHDDLLDHLGYEAEAGKAALREVAGVMFDGVADGKLDESAIPNDDYEGHYLYPADTKSESTYAVVDADGMLRRGNVESAHSLGCRGRCDDPDEHDNRLRALAREFDSVPEWAQEEEEEQAEAAKHKYEADAAGISQGDIVTWNSQGERPAAGRVIETIDEGRYDTELSGDATVNAPAALIRLYRPSGDGEWGKTDVTVAHKTDTDTLTRVDDWPDVAMMQAAHLVDINSTEVDLTPPDYVVAAAQAGLDAKEQYDELADCGTGVGEARARAIVNNDLAPSDFTGGENTAIPDYLNSHSEDAPATDDSPPEWDEDTWTDGCGPVQYALWGGTGDGRALEWFADKEAQLHDAMDTAEAAADNASTQTRPAESGVDSDINDMADDNPDPDDPEDLTELKARLSDKTDRIDELEAELSAVKAERDEFEQKADAVDEAEEAFAAALADHVPRDAEALKADLSLTQMREWVADIEEASVGDAAVSDSDPEPAVQSGGGEPEAAELSAAARKEKDELESKLEEQEARLAQSREGSMAHSLAQGEKERIEEQLEELEA